MMKRKQCLLMLFFMLSLPFLSVMMSKNSLKRKQRFLNHHTFLLAGPIRKKKKKDGLGSAQKAQKLPLLWVKKERVQTQSRILKNVAKGASLDLCFNIFTVIKLKMDLYFNVVTRVSPSQTAALLAQNIQKRDRRCIVGVKCCWHSVTF